MKRSLSFLAGFAFGSCLVAQSTTTTVTITKVDYEVGATYSGSIATLVLPCDSDDLHIYGATWGDGSAPTITTDAPLINQYRQRGTWHLFDKDHIYKKSGTYTASIQFANHCVGQVNAALAGTAGTATVTAHQPVPLLSLSADAKELQAGSDAAVTVLLTSPAPAWGARVYLISSSPRLSVPGWCDVAAGDVGGEFHATAVKDIKEPEEVSVTAKTIGSPQILRLTVKPAAVTPTPTPTQ